MNQRKRADTPAMALDHEFAPERASALGRLGRTFEAALAALAAFDASHPRTEATATSNRTLRTALVQEASVALWQFVVQREACGLRDMRAVLRDYAVPPEVAANMGVLPERTVRRRR